MNANRLRPIFCLGICLGVGACGFGFAIPAAAADTGLSLKKKQRVVLIGGPFVHGIQKNGYLETLIHTRLPEHRIVFRNLGVDAKEAASQLESKDLSKLDGKLSALKTDVLIIGVNDLSKELGATLTRSRQALSASLQAVVLAAKAYGRSAIDGVYNDFGDKVGFYIQCEQGKSLGFDGKSLIHPTQVDAANEVFSPDADTIEHARNVIEAFEAAEKEGKGVAVLGGQMIEALHVAEARNVLALAEKINGG